MWAFGPAQRILLGVAPVDFRKGLDGLAAWCRQQLREDPLDGTVFVFTNRSRRALRLLFYDGQGFWLAAKRFSQGRLFWWPRGDAPAHPLAARELAVLLWNGQPQMTPWAPLWRPLPVRAPQSAGTSSRAETTPARPAAGPPR